MQTYKERIEQAIQYIESNLTEQLNTELVAGSVHLSYYHFHRIFFAMTGETIGDYIRKRRLTEAAIALLTNHKTILDIALEYRFESPEAFSRSFKKAFGTTPNSFRKKGTHSVISEKGKLLGGSLQHRFNKISISPAIVEIGRDIQIVGVKGTVSLHQNDIPLLWSTLLQRKHEISDIRANSSAYGICPGTPSLPFSDITEYTPFTQYAGFEVDSFQNVPHGMAAHTIRSGTFAVFKHEGKTCNLRDSYNYIWGTWLNNTSLQLDNRDDFELYGHDFYGEDNEESTIWIYIPVIM